MSTLVTRWPLDEALGLDRQGYDADDVLINPVTPVNGVLQVPSEPPPDGSPYAAGFDADQDQYLAITDVAQTGLNPGTGDFTITLRFLATAGEPDGDYGLVSKGGVSALPFNNGGYYILLRKDAGDLRVMVFFGTGGVDGPGGQCIFSEVVTPDEWHFLVMNFDRDGDFAATLDDQPLTPGFNGTLASMSGFFDTTGACNPDNDFRIGAADDGAVEQDATSFYDGSIDDVRYYSGLFTPPHFNSDTHETIITARAGLARAGISRAALAPEADRLGPGGTSGGFLKYKRYPPNHADPTVNAGSWTVTRD